VWPIGLQPMSLNFIDISNQNGSLWLGITPIYGAIVGVTDQALWLHSVAREKVLEHLFVGELLQSLWRNGIYDTEVLRAEVDAGGYDLVLESSGVLRHVQLKSSRRNAKRRHVTINSALMRKPSGCVVWIEFDPETMTIGPFLWLGAEPHQPLPALGERIAKHTRADSTGVKKERPNMRSVPRTRFRTLATMDDVTRELFGMAVREASTQAGGSHPPE
jgi:hypothetical protein